jgi:Bacteriophage head to tail connecting protein
MKTLDHDQLAQFVLKRHETLVNKRSVWDSFWEDLADYAMPRKSEFMNKSQRLTPSVHRNTVLFDGTMVYANMVLANGCMSYLTPADARWFSFDSPAFLKGVDSVEQYYRRCTEIAMLELARSNFYTEAHELYMDRGCFGTGVLHCETGKRSFLNFRKFDIGTFSIAEDDEGYVDTLSREFYLTVRQAVQWFGKEGVSDTIQKLFDSGQAEQLEREFCFIHQIFPRAADEIEFGKRDVRNMPIASVYIEKDKKLVVRESGYTEQPFFATRYLKWYSEMPYGWSPAWVALPEARQLNFLQKQLDALAELTAFPRFLIPDTHEGEVDFRASGVTYYDPANPNAIPREWATGGRYDIGKDRVVEKQKAIDKAFHVDLFQMFANLDRPQMTAREVAERAGEKLIQFSPTFARLTTELFTPLLRRVFSLLTRNGRLPPPPKEVIQQSPGGEAFLPEPEVVYSSKIALAIKSLENASLMNTFELWMPISQGKPEVFDNVNWDETFRDSVRNAGLPARWLVEMEEVQQIRQKRQEEMERMQKQAEMAAQADAAGKVGSVKEDSLVGRALQEQQKAGGGLSQTGANGRRPGGLLG